MKIRKLDDLMIRRLQPKSFFCGNYKKMAASHDTAIFYDDLYAYEIFSLMAFIEM